MEFSIDESSILSKLKIFAGTKKGAEIINNNVDINSDMMLEAARMFRQTLIDVMDANITSYSVASIPKNPSNFYADTPTKWVDEDGDGINEWRVTMSFDKQAIKRKSLAIIKQGEIVRYTNEHGIDNIISLFDTGYGPTRATVYGWWLSRNKYVAAVRAREGLNFMQHAIDLFNERYGREYGCHAAISEDCQYYVKNIGLTTL